MVICEGFFIKGGVTERDQLLAKHPPLEQAKLENLIKKGESIRLCCGFPFDMLQLSKSPLCCCPYYTDGPLDICGCPSTDCLKSRKTRLARIKIQVENYFDDANLYKQTELLKAIDSNSYFPLTVVMKLPGLAEMRVTRRDLIQACRNSAIVEIDPTFSKIRRTNLVPASQFRTPFG
nr:hypothetical transcript [Hymenolepis microstoma]